MMDRTYLYIQKPGASVVRVVELAGSIARVGSGASCEVQLDNPKLGEVACILRKRGISWHAQPTSERHSITLDGRPLTRTQPVPHGAALKIGGVWISLRVVRAAIELDLPGSFDSPLQVEQLSRPAKTAFSSVPARASSTADRVENRADPVLNSAAAAVDERWRSGFEARLRWLAERRSEQRARAAAEAARSKPLSQAAEELLDAHHRAEPPAAASQQAPLTPIPMDHGDRLALDVTESDSPPHSALADEEFNDAPVSMKSAEVATEPVHSDPSSTNSERPWSETHTTLDSGFALDEASCDRASDAAARSAPVQPPETTTNADDATDRKDSAKSSSQRIDPTESAAGRVEISHSPTSPWPRMRDIIAAQARNAPPTSRVRARAKSAPPVPTAPREPSSIRLPFWFAWTTLSTVAIACCALMLSLSWTWAIDDRDAAQFADATLTRPSLIDSPNPNAEAVDATTWWSTTADHLYDRFVSLGHFEAGEDRAVRAKQLIDLARGMSPLHPGARFASVAASSGPEPAGSPAMTHDAVTYALDARRRQSSGDTKGAIAAYHAALLMAEESESIFDSNLVHVDDLEMQRFALPGEELVAPIVAEILGQPNWSRSEWSQALPAGGVSQLVAIRTLRSRGAAEAETMLDQFLNADERPGSEETRALRCAARAEAHAIRRQWSESQTAYRDAIMSMPIENVRRGWSANLAEIARRAGDHTSMHDAIASAHRPDGTGDEITHRALQTRARSESADRTFASGISKRPLAPNAN